MKLEKIDHLIPGYRQMDPEETAGNFDVIIWGGPNIGFPSKIGKSITDFTDPLAFLRGDFGVLCIGDHTYHKKASVVLDFMIKQYKSYKYLDKNYEGAPGATFYSVWRKKLEVPKRIWQFEPLPLP